MTPKEQRIAIAEACGWELTEDHEHWAMGYRNGVQRCFIPGYLTDLNAMHDVEKLLSDNQWATYFNNLTDHCLSKFAQQKQYVHATAAQRAEAFLKTISKWKD